MFKHTCRKTSLTMTTINKISAEYWVYSFGTDPNVICPENNKLGKKEPIIKMAKEPNKAFFNRIIRPK